jgi:lipopolysaccharide export system permease protein
MDFNIFPKILFSYLIKIYLKNILIVLLIFLFLIFLIDFIEIYRRASEKINFKTNDNFISILIYLSLLKLPLTIKNILPISILISSVLTFIKWRQNNYFVIVRTVGISLKKTIFLPCALVLFIGVLSIFFLHPLANYCNFKYKSLENKYFGHKVQETISLSKNGIWIRKKTSDGFLIIKSENITKNKNILNNVEIFRFDNNNNFINKIIANTASLQGNILLLKKGKNLNPQIKNKFFDIFSIKLSNKFKTFNLNSELAENMNLVDLYNYITLMKNLGVNYSNHLIYLLKQLFQPILIVSLILISAPLILKNNERKFPLTIMCLTILIGFVIYFLVDFMYVLGSMEKLNPYIAGIGPIGVCFFIGCYLVSAFDEIKK